MEIHGVASAMYAKGGVSSFSVSTLRAQSPDDVRLVSTKTETFDTADKAQTLSQYDRLMDAILDASKKQHQQMPGQELVTVFGAPPDFPITQVTLHALERFHAILGDGGVRKLTAELSERNDPEQDFPLLSSGLFVHANAMRDAETVPIHVIARKFISHDVDAPYNAQLSPRQQNHLELLQILLKAADAGNEECREILRKEAVVMGRTFAVHAKLKDYQESRFIRPHPAQMIGLDILKKYDLRERFAEGIQQITGWNFPICIRLSGDVAKPAFVDVTGSFISQQVAQLLKKPCPLTINVRL